MSALEFHEFSSLMSVSTLEAYAALLNDFNVFQLTEQQLRKEISHRGIEKISSELHFKWREMPAALGMRQAVVEDIKCESGLDEEGKRGLFLRKWKKSRKKEATYERLVLAFLERKERRNAGSS